MTAKKRNRKGPKGSLACSWCPKRGMNELGLSAHVRQTHPEHRDQAKAEAEARRVQAKREKREAAQAAKEAPPMAEDQYMPPPPTEASMQAGASHMHDGFDGPYTHSHQWGEAPHVHDANGGPPRFIEVAVHPAQLAKDDHDEDEKSEEQKNREHALALEEAKKVRAEAESPVEASVGDPEGDIVIHVVKDGLTLLGKVWAHGDNITIRRGSATYKSTFDSEGKTWLDLDEPAQMRRWGFVGYRPGPFVGIKENMSDDEFTELLMKAETEEERRRLEKMRQRNQVPVGAPLAPSNIA